MIAIDLPPRSSRSAPTWPSPNTSRSPATATKLKATFANGANISTNSPVRIAGVEVGKVISAERDGDATKVTFTVDGAGPADPRRRLRRDPAADLPRGQLLHRTRPRQPERAGTGQRRHDPGQPHLDRGPARRDPDRAAVAGPRRPQPPAGELRHSADRQADRGRRRDPAARGARARPAPRRSTAPSNTAATPAATAPRSPTRCSAPSRTTSRALVAGAGRTFGAFARQRGRPAGPDRQLQHLHRRPRRPVGEPLDDDPPASPRPCSTAPHLAGQPQPHAAAAARLGDRARPRRSPSCPGLIAAVETVARTGPPAALRQGGRRRRQAAAPKRRRGSPAPPRPARRTPCRSSTGSASARPRSWSRPATRRSTTASAPAGPTTASSSTTLDRLRRPGQNFDGNGPYLRVQPGGGNLLRRRAEPERQPQHRARQNFAHTAAAPIGHPAAARRPAAEEARSPLRHATPSPTSTAPLGQAGAPDPDA